MNWLKTLTPEHIQNLVPYASARRDDTEGGEIWLNANESPFVQRVDGSRSDLNRYPEFQPAELVQAFADYVECGSDQILVTRGVDEGIDLLVRTFCTAGKDQLVYTPPTYGMYKISAETNGVGAISVPLLADWELDVDGICQQLDRTKLVFICSPNNPTGNIPDRQSVRDILAAASQKALVILDEAYVEFDAETSYVSLLKEYPNLVVMRTLSKAFGLAGIRCGFLMANPAVISTLQKVIAPYPIPVPVADLAVEALSDAGISSMKKTVESINQERGVVGEVLQELSFVDEVFPGSANFILVRVEDSKSLLNYLQSNGIIIRDRSSQYGLENCVRITIGSQPENKRLVETLKRFEETR